MVLIVFKAKWNRLWHTQGAILKIKNTTKKMLLVNFHYHVSQTAMLNSSKWNCENGVYNFFFKVAKSSNRDQAKPECLKTSSWKRLMLSISNIYFLYFIYFINILMIYTENICHDNKSLSTSLRVRKKQLLYVMHAWIYP